MAMSLAALNVVCVAINVVTKLFVLSNTFAENTERVMQWQDSTHFTIQESAE